MPADHHMRRLNELIRLGWGDVPQPLIEWAEERIGMLPYVKTPQYANDYAWWKWVQRVVGKRLRRRCA